MEGLQASMDGDVRQVPRCGTCGSERVVRDAWAAWNADFGRSRIETGFDHTRSQAYDAGIAITWREPVHPVAAVLGSPPMCETSTATSYAFPISTPGRRAAVRQCKESVGANPGQIDEIADAMCPNRPKNDPIRK